jgi:hypothetical protein
MKAMQPDNSQDQDRLVDTAFIAGGLFVGAVILSLWAFTAGHAWLAFFLLTFGLVLTIKAIDKHNPKAR